MLYNLKIMLRNLKRDKFYSAINIGGLAIGMAASALLLAWVYNQWSYDRFHAKAKQLYLVWDREISSSGGMPYTSFVIGPALKDQYPEIVESARVVSMSGCYYGEGDRHISFTAKYADPSFLAMFSFPLLHGDANTALNDPYSIIITEKAAKRLFGNEDPMGKTLICDFQHPVTVTGVMKDLPNNTRFDFEILGTLQFVERTREWNTTSWYINILETYVELSPHAQLGQVNAAIRDIIKNNTDQQAKREVFLYSLSNSYLKNLQSSLWFSTLLKMFTVLAVIILLVACINFVNLSTARGASRAKEVGVRKVLGSRLAGLVRLFLSESMILALISGVIAFIIVAIAMPYFSGWLSGLMGKRIFLDIFNIRFWLFALSFILLTGLLAGAYPAFYLSAFSPVKVLKGVARIGGSRRITLRKVLVTFQFFVAVFLIISALVARKQIVYAQNRSTGWDREQLISIWLTDEIKEHYQVFRNDLLALSGVIDATRTNHMFNLTATNVISWQGKDPEARIFFNHLITDGNWAEMMGVELVAGRYPDLANRPADSTAFLLNETAVRIIGFENPVGEPITFFGHDGQVVGVIRDLVFNPFNNIGPLIVGCNEKIYRQSMLYIRLSAGNTAEKLASIESIYKKYSPNRLFDYRFTDEEYVARNFGDIKSFESLAGLSTVIAVLISCMGLFALAALTAERRRKEIGIRKVFGASITDITLQILKEYIILTLVAFVIAVPFAWFALTQLLNTIPYRTNISWWLFLIVGGMSLCITLLTVGIQALKAATTNPVNAIKSE
jgi:ABC-type antimicrobial peptide transport system permease subunit